MGRIEDLDILYTVCTTFRPPVYSIPPPQFLVFSVDSYDVHFLILDRHSDSDL